MLFTTARWVYVADDGSELPLTAHIGRPMLLLTIGGEEARITTEQKLLAYGVNAVHLLGRALPGGGGAGVFDEMTVAIPDMPWVGLKATTFDAFTDDPDVVALTKEFMAANNAGTFAPQIIVA